MDMKHTSGPMEAIGNIIRSSLVQPEGLPNGVQVAECRDAHSDPNSEEAKAYARRFAACFNACEGISTENLENNRPVKWLAKQYNAAAKRQGEMMEALERIVRMLEVEDARLANFGETEAARAVIAKIKGEA